VVDGFRRDFFLHDRGKEGSSPEVVLERGRRQFGLAAVGGFSVRRRLVVALSGGSPAKVRGKTGAT
jgi:hypothetical protein